MDSHGMVGDSTKEISHDHELSLESDVSQEDPRTSEKPDVMQKNPKNKRSKLPKKSTIKKDKIDSHGTVGNYAKDISNGHKPPSKPQKQFLCSVCGLLFETNSTYKMHLTRRDLGNCGMMNVVPVIHNHSENYTNTMVPKQKSSYDAGFKLEVVEFAKKCQNNHYAARKFNISEKLVRAWKKAAPVLATLPRTKKAN